MALPLIPLALRAGLALAKNKKAREALTKSVGGFLNRRQNLTPLLRRGRKPSSGKGLSTGTAFATGTAFGAGGKLIIEANRDKKLQEAKKDKKTNQRRLGSKAKPVSRRFR